MTPILISPALARIQPSVVKCNNKERLMATFPLSLPAIKVKQPLGEFFAFSIDAETLRKVAFFDPTRIEKVDKKKFWYSLLGAQRPSSTRRAKQIAKYINTVESAFPNSIIIAA